jgi:hypothetical protein
VSETFVERTVECSLEPVLARFEEPHIGPLGEWRCHLRLTELGAERSPRSPVSMASKRCFSPCPTQILYCDTAISSRPGSSLFVA